MALGLGAGSLAVGDRRRRVAAWSLASGFGAGLSLSTAASTAMVELDADHSGVGAALVQATVKLGPAIGATFLGTILAATYQHQVPVTGCRRTRPPPSRRASSAASPSRRRRARRPSPKACGSPRVGVADALRFAAAAAALGVIPALAFLPRQVRSAAAKEARSGDAPIAVTG